jgi:HSP20 family protein
MLHRQDRLETAGAHLLSEGVSDGQTPVEVKKTIAARTPDAWHSFRGELDRLFDRFAGSLSLPSFRRMFDVEPAWRTESSFSFPSPSVDVTEDGKAYKITGL